MTLKKITIAAIAVCLMAVGAAAQTNGSFTDTRDKKTYRTVKIGKLTWMAENLNYRTKDSWCYGNDDKNCAKYGRLYTWDAAMKACPAGWRLSSDADWDSLMTAVGGVNIAGTKLKSQSGWYNNGNGTDEYGFSALPGGFRGSDGSFNDAGNYGYWWSATEYDASNARNWYMGYNDDGVRWYNWVKTRAMSVRCVRE